MDAQDVLMDLAESFIKDQRKIHSGALFDWNEEMANEFSRIPIEHLIRDPYFLGFKDKIYDGVLEDIVDLFEERKHRQINLAVFLEGIGCVDPLSTWCWTENGLVLLKNIKNSIKVHTGKNIKEVLGRKKENKKSFKIKTCTGLELIISDTHPLWLMNKEGIPKWDELLKTFKVGDYLAIPKGFNYFGTKEINLDLSWVLGCLMGDGCLTSTIRITAHEDDRFILDEIKRILKIHFSDVLFWEVRNSKRPTNIRLSIKGEQVREWLKIEGLLGKNAFEKTVPISVLQGTKEVWANFISGYYDTDGSSRKKGIRVTSVSKVLLQQIQLAFYNFGIISRLCIKKTSWKNGKSFTNRLKIDSDSALLFYNEIGFRLSRKQFNKRNLINIKFNPNLDIIPNQVEILYKIWKESGQIQKGFKTIINKNYGSYGQFPSKEKLKKFYNIYKDSKDKTGLELIKTRLEENIFWDEIVNITELENMELLDLAVDTDNQYISNGCISHNSGKTVKASIIEWLMWFELTLCWPTPQEYFDLAPNSVIALINLNRTEKQAKKVTFTEVFNRFQSGFNKDYFPISDRYTSEIRITRNSTTIFPGTSSALSALGYNLYGGTIDEAAFLEVIDDSTRSFDGQFDAAEEMYHAIMNRMTSRFLRRGTIPGLLCMISSPNFPDDFLHRQIEYAVKVQEEIKLTKGDDYSGIFWKRRPTWEAKGEKFFPENEFFYIDTENGEIMEDRNVKAFLDSVSKELFPLKVDPEVLYKVAQFIKDAA